MAPDATPIEAPTEQEWKNRWWKLTTPKLSSQTAIAYEDFVLLQKKWIGLANVSSSPPPTKSVTR